MKSLYVFLLQTPNKSTQQAWSSPTHLSGTQPKLVETGVLIHLSPPSQQVPLLQEEQNRLQPQDFLEQPSDNRRVGWRLEGLDGWDDGWGTGDPGGRGDSPADTVHDPGGDVGQGAMGEQHNHWTVLEHPG